ncbi:phage neck terminator protein [Arsenophonus endosymbiont of Crataerina pallida]|uniref:phage neck terminator protein n=1 Tax=Arsenophonus endosymbiont of Crataerina pallida TaxID=3066235 RepID=UPI0030D2198B
MSNNSSTEAGWLTPFDDNALYNEGLNRLLSRWVGGVSGLPAKQVLPRWQSKPAPLPSPDTNWCAFGIIDITSEPNPALVKQSDESSELWQYETLTCMASFYGREGMVYAARFRDGIMLSQNNAELNKSNLTLGSHSQITAFPELINNQWVNRFDITVHLRRKVVRRYHIKSVTDAHVTFLGDK